MTHVSFICYMLGYTMGLLDNISNSFINFIIEDSIVLSTFIISYLLYNFKKISLQTSMKILSIMVVADMLYPSIIFSNGIPYTDYLERNVVILIILVIVVAFTTNTLYALVINSIIIVNLILASIITNHADLIEMLPTVVMCIGVMGGFCIVFARLIKRLLENEIESRNKLRKLGDFKQKITRLVLHDMKVPINSIQNISSNNSNKDMKEVNHQIENLHKQIENVLDIEKLEEPQLSLQISHNNIQLIINSAVKKVEVLAFEKNITIETIFQSKGSIKCDEIIIERLIINLLTNAIKHSPANDKITLSLKSSDVNYIISVKDNGIGIAAEHHKNIFDKFFIVKSSSSRSGSSTGLGLTFCKLAAETHNGSIRVISEINKGAEFIVELPIDSSTEIPETEIKQYNKIINFTTDEIEQISKVVECIKHIPIYKASEIIGTINNNFKNKTENINT